MRPSNVCAGFKKCGIYPFNHIPEHSELTSAGWSIEMGSFGEVKTYHLMVVRIYIYIYFLVYACMYLCRKGKAMEENGYNVLVADGSTMIVYLRQLLKLPIIQEKEKKATELYCCPECIDYDNY